MKHVVQQHLNVVLALVVWGIACSSNDPVECPSPTILCGIACRDVSNDRNHCGSCGRACNDTQTCEAGRCVTQCPTGQSRCGATCADLANDRTNCGACGRTCGGGEVCVEGACDTDCGPLTTCADLGPGGAQMLYCANLLLDRTNCGRCGNVCPEGNVCRAGVCQVSCPVGQLACNDRCVDPQIDRSNCGACGAVCASGFDCVRGRCTIGGCASGAVLCAGACVNLMRDRNHCGACLAQCPSGYLCSGGECRFSCSPGETQCADGCVDLMNDTNHCGMCARRCAPGELCRSGTCGVVCQSGQTLCDGRCTVLARDRAHCGACGRACSMTQTCVDGTCTDTCGAGQTRCGTFCLDLRSDPSNCGACGRTCDPSMACVEGVCRMLSTMPGPAACPSPSRVCSGVCTDVRADNNHCGACGAPCQGDTLCVQGMCVRPCATGEQRCASGRCSTLEFDAQNCGACGNVCPEGQYCVRARCGTTAPPGTYRVERAVPGVTFIDACAVPGATRHLAGINEGEVSVMLPFALRYWSTDLLPGAPVILSANGWFSLTGSGGGTTSPFAPSTSAPNGMVALHAGDLMVNDPICVATLGIAPRRRWIIEWSGAQERSGAMVVASTQLIFEAVITERTDTIDFVYNRMDTTLSRYHGLESPTGAAGVSACTTTSFLCAVPTGTVVRFVPTP